MFSHLGPRGSRSEAWGRRVARPYSGLGSWSDLGRGSPLPYLGGQEGRGQFRQISLPGAAGTPSGNPPTSLPHDTMACLAPVGVCHTDEHHLQLRSNSRRVNALRFFVDPRPRLRSNSRRVATVWLVSPRPGLRSNSRGVAVAGRGCIHQGDNLTFTDDCWSVGQKTDDCVDHLIKFGQII